jgi:hypothetical protein
MIPVMMNNYLWGTILIWAGMLIWAPFLILQIAGKHPSFLSYLPFHLVGVIGGSCLRLLARRKMGITPPRRNRIQIAGTVMIALGILPWVPYFYLRLFTQTSVKATNILPFHLTGVFGGILLLIINRLATRKDRGQ